MGVVIKRKMDTMSGGTSQKTIGKIISGVKDKVIIIRYGESGRKTDEVEKIFEDGTNVDMIIKWRRSDWIQFLREFFFPFYGPGRYYVVNMMGGKGLVKLFGPEYVD